MRLAFDVCDQTSVFSWEKPDGSRDHTLIDSGKSTEILLPTLQEIQKRCGCPISQLGVVTGPGSFTGIRVGLATTLGLKLATGIPAFGFTRFQLVAWHLGQGRYCLLLPAGKKEVIKTWFDQGQQLGPAEICLKSNIQPDPSQVTIQPIDHIEARSLDLNLTNLCLDLMNQNPTEQEFPLEPLYIRPPDAKKSQTLLEKLLAGI